MQSLCTTDPHLEGLRDGLRELCAKWTVAADAIIVVTVTA